MSGGAASVRRGKATQRAVAQFYRLVGRCVVYENSDPGQRKGEAGHRGAPGRTPGLPDLWVCHEPSGRAWWAEVKAGSGRLSKPQCEFKRVSELCGVPVIVGDTMAAQQRLVELGIITVNRGIVQYVWSKERKGERPRPAVGVSDAGRRP